ncbi:putative multidrug resistance ABC transporter ATP-binding/permease protein YheH [compost metagenome]
MVAHRLSTVRALDRLLVMDRGRIIEEGSHDQLIRLQGGLYRRLFERQALELTKGLTAAEMLQDGATPPPVKDPNVDPSVDTDVGEGTYVFGK